MTLNFELNRKDVVTGARALSVKLKWICSVCIALVAVAGIFSIRNIQNMLADGDVSGIIATLLPVVTFGLVLGLVFWLSPYLSARKVIVRKMEWRFSEDGVQIQTPVSTSEIKWEAFIKYREAKTIFLLYPQKNIAYIIPKRVLDNAQLIELRNLFSSHVKKV